MARQQARGAGLPHDDADLALPVADNVIAGVFEVRGWRRDPQVVGKVPGGKVVFDLAEAPDWQWLIGQDSPVTWRKSEANPVRKVGTAIVSELRSRRPHHSDAGNGWSLDVDPDGTAATVRGPGCLAVTGVQDGCARLALARPTEGECWPQPRGGQHSPSHRARPKVPLTRSTMSSPSTAPVERHAAIVGLAWVLVGPSILAVIEEPSAWQAASRSRITAATRTGTATPTQSAWQPAGSPTDRYASLGSRLPDRSEQVAVSAWYPQSGSQTLSRRTSISPG